MLSTQAMKNYEVNIPAYSTVLVLGAKSEEQAINLACDKVKMGDFNQDDPYIEGEVHAGDIARARLHADRIVRSK